MENKSLSVSISEFSKKMGEFFPSLLREFKKEHVQKLKEGKVTFPQVLILEALYKEDERIMSELAEQLSITRSATTELVDRMSKVDLVTRLRDEGDRRQVKVRLTQRGRRLIGKILRRKRDMLAQIFKRINPMERRILLDAFGKLYSVMSTHKV